MRGRKSQADRGRHHPDQVTEFRHAKVSSPPARSPMGKSPMGKSSKLSNLSVSLMASLGQYVSRAVRR
jgi:hypothetical protein